MPEQEVLFMRSPWAPLHIERAEGAYLYTRDGHKLLDAGSGAVVVNIGQGREELAKIAEETVRRLNYVVPVWVTTEREKLVNRLAGWTPPWLRRRS
jgi:adenosylmethionine-8-amino-7-oxononanoate aminotransferase